MVHIQVMCDKCNCEILHDRLCFDVRSGRLRVKRPQVDLCGDCEREFEKWLGLDGSPRYRISREEEEVEND